MNNGTLRSEYAEIQRFAMDMTGPIVAGDSTQTSPPSSTTYTRAECVKIMVNDMTTDEFAFILNLKTMFDNDRLTAKHVGEIIVAIAAAINGPYRNKKR